MTPAKRLILKWGLNFKSGTYQTLKEPNSQNNNISIIGEPRSPENRTELPAPRRFVPKTVQQAKKTTATSWI